VASRRAGRGASLRHVRQHADVVGGHFQPAAFDGDRAPVAAGRVAERARPQLGQQRGVTTSTEVRESEYTDSEAPALAL